MTIKNIHTICLLLWSLSDLWLLINILTEHQNTIVSIGSQFTRKWSPEKMVKDWLFTKDTRLIVNPLEKKNES